MKEMMEVNELRKFTTDGRIFNLGPIRGSNGSFSRHALTMMILKKNPLTSFSSLKSHKDRKNYWRVSAYLRGKTNTYTLLK